MDASALYTCTNLASITIPDGITYIGYMAFFDCTQLKSITWRGTTYTNKTTFNNALKNAGVATDNVWN